MVYYTFDEWKDLGFYVNFGEKSFKRNELGKCVFSESQVSENEDDFSQFASEFEFNGPYY